MRNLCNQFHNELDGPLGIISFNVGKHMWLSIQWHLYSLQTFAKLVSCSFLKSATGLNITFYEGTRGIFSHTLFKVNAGSSLGYLRASCQKYGEIIKKILK